MVLLEDGRTNRDCVACTEQSEVHSSSETGRNLGSCGLLAEVGRDVLVGIRVDQVRLQSHLQIASVN